MAKEIRFWKDTGRYVFYNNLQKYQPDLYAQLIKRKSLANYGGLERMKNIANRLKLFSTIEAKKEISFLEKFFQVKIFLPPKALLDKKIGKEIIDNINFALQFKGTFDRFYSRIMSGKERITNVGNFAEMLSRSLRKKIEQNLQYDLTKTPEQLVESALSDEVVYGALEEVIFSKIKNSKDDRNSDSQGYKEFLTALEASPWKHSFLKSVYDAYGLDKIRKNILKTLSSTQNETTLTTEQKNSLIKRSIKDSSKKRNSLSAIFSQMAMQLIADGLGGIANTHFVSNTKNNSGAINVVATFGLNMDKIEEIIDGDYKDKQERVEAYKSLHRKMKDMRSNFIVYTKAYDRMLQDTNTNGRPFGNSGISAGKPMSLEDFESVIRRTPGDNRDLIEAIMSTMEGAVFYDIKADIEKELIQKMGYFLFDDVLAIGSENVGAQYSIHLFNLDGMYIPISYLFLLVAEAIEEVSSNLDDFFVVDINSGAIKYEYGGKNGAEIWTTEDWLDQRDEAYRDIKIKAYFLKNLADVLKGL